MATKAHHPPPDPRRFGEAEPEEFARSRTSLKKERVNNERALTELGDELLKQSPALWAQLGLSEAACEALATTRLIKSFAAKNRHLRLVRARLRDLDWMSIRAQLDQRRAGYMESRLADADELVRTWTEQLLVQNDEGLARFVELYAAPNRGRLRQLVRNVQQAGESKRHKARLSLMNAVSEVIAQAAADPTATDQGLSDETNDQALLP